MKDYKSKLDKILGKNINPSSKPSLWHKLYEDAPVSMPAAPVAPSRPTTKPLTSPGTKPSTKPSPLSPKINPGALPKPRAQRDGINEAYEEFVNPGTQKLFKSGDSRFGFSQHPMMKAHGDKLARAAYKHSTGKVYSSMAELEGLSANDKKNRLGQMTMRALQEIKRIEAAHATELEEIAIDVVANLYNLGEEDKNKLNAFLRRPQHDAPPDEDDDDGVEEFADDEGDDITHEVHKRHSMNLMSQGAAIHNMHDVHLQDEIKDRLDALDPGLVDLYSQFGRGSSHTYWLYDMNMMLNVQLGGAMGSVNLTPSGEVIAQAPIFPVLVQELIKGVIMLISHHQFESMSPAKTRKIIAAADTLHDEFPQIMVGPKVWRAFILALPSAYRGRLMEVVMTLARAHPKELNIIMVKLGECIANDEDPRTSSVASALQDLLERTLSEETPEDIAAMLPDGEDDFDTGEDDDDEDDGRLYTESWGKNLALAAGAVGSMMGIGGPAGAQTPTTPTTPNQIPLLANQSIDGYRARHKTKTPPMTAKQLEAMMDRLNADQAEREAKMSHHEKLKYQIQKAREARSEKESVPDYKRLMGAIGDEGPSGSANKSGESATERGMRMAKRFADPQPPTEYKIGEGPAERNPDGTINQEVTDIFREIGPQMGRIEKEKQARMQERYKQAERFIPK